MCRVAAFKSVFAQCKFSKMNIRTIMTDFILPFQAAVASQGVKTCWAMSHCVQSDMADIIYTYTKRLSCLENVSC